MIGLLQSGEIEIGAAHLLFKTPRLDALDYAGETVRYEWVHLEGVYCAVDRRIPQTEQ